uniref:GED domain-containing protein n=1 Tax=Oryza glaberrima TaxID=4538 RepID=I1P9P2_ORYGL
MSKKLLPIMATKSAKDLVGDSKALVAASDVVTGSAIAESYNDQIRPLLDAVDRLRHLKVTQEGIQLPTIVVVGDQSSGKSSVLESLAGISLPRGQGICTRVPLVMRLQDDPSADSPKLQLEHSNGRVVTTSEAKVADAINAATAEIAGSGKGISDAPITLVVRKRGVPDLTLVDLPGITRVPVQGQPDDIYDQIAKIIKPWTTSTSASATSASATALARRRTTRRASRRSGCSSIIPSSPRSTSPWSASPVLPAEDKEDSERPLSPKASRTSSSKINDRVSSHSSEVDQMPPDLNNVADAVRAFFHIVKQVCASLEKVLVRGEFDEFPDDRHFHGTARIAEKMDGYKRRLPAECPKSSDDDAMFLMEEVRVLEETKGINLPNFLLRSAFLVLLKKKVETVMHVPHELVNEVWGYVEDVVMNILLKHSENFPQVQPSCRRAVQTLMDKARARSAQHVKELIEMELVSDYTANPDYMRTWTEIMEGHDSFMEAVEDGSKPARITLEGFGEVDVSHLRAHAGLAGQAFDLRARLTAYWRSIVLRLVDGLALHVLRGVKRLVEHDLEAELADELLGNKMAGVERMLAPSPSTGAKRERLKKSIVLLRQSKEVVANIMDRISAAGEV